MKIEDLRKKTKEEAEKLLLEAKEKLTDLKFKVAAKQFKNVREIGKTKKLIAQIMTVLYEKSK